MIGTPETKYAQLTNGFYQSGTGPTKVLILGCCRTMAYLNYLVRWNNQSGNQLTIYRIDPTDWNWDINENVVDLNQILDQCRGDGRILSVLRQSKIFIHEYYRYYGMFNTDKDQADNIYNFGIQPDADICLPNFHDKFVLFQDQVTFDAETRERIKREGMSGDVIANMRDVGLSSLDKFYEICQMSSFPEFGDLFRHTWRNLRYFWTGNHVSKHFTLTLFRMINDKFLHLPTDHAFWSEAGSEDQFSRPCTRVTQHDIGAYELMWDCQPEELHIP